MAGVKQELGPRILEEEGRDGDCGLGRERRKEEHVFHRAFTHCPRIQSLQSECRDRGDQAMVDTIRASCLLSPHS